MRLRMFLLRPPPPPPAEPRAPRSVGGPPAPASSRAAPARRVVARRRRRGWRSRGRAAASLPPARPPGPGRRRARPPRRGPPVRRVAPGRPRRAAARRVCLVLPAAARSLWPSGSSHAFSLPTVPLPLSISLLRSLPGLRALLGDGAGWSGRHHPTAVLQPSLRLPPSTAKCAMMSEPYQNR